MSIIFPLTDTLAGWCLSNCLLEAYTLEENNNLLRLLLELKFWISSPKLSLNLQTQASNNKLEWPVDEMKTLAVKIHVEAALTEVTIGAKGGSLSPPLSSSPGQD